LTHGKGFKNENRRDKLAQRKLLGAASLRFKNKYRGQIKKSDQQNALQFLPTVKHNSFHCHTSLRFSPIADRQQSLL
jgi:hypothetical protein